MKKTLLATAALIAMSTSAFALTDLSAASLSAEFPTAQKIEVNRGLFRTKVEVIIDGQKIEIFYNNTTLQEVTRRTKTVSGSDVDQMRSNGMDVHDYEVGGQYYDETDYETDGSDRHNGNDRNDDNDRSERENRRSERHSDRNETRDHDSGSNDFGSDNNDGFDDRGSNDHKYERDDHDSERSHKDDDHKGNDNDWDD